MDTFFFFIINIVSIDIIRLLSIYKYFYTNKNFVKLKYMIKDNSEIIVYILSFYRLNIILCIV